MPAVPHAAQAFESNKTESILINGSLQAGYLIMALRAVGLDCGPEITLPTVDTALGLDEMGWEGKFLLNVGYGNPDKHYPRAPRLSLEEATRKF